MRTLNIVLVLLLLIAGAHSTWAQAPVARFSANKTSGCAPLAVSFTDESLNNPTSWNWDLGNGQLSTARNPVGQYRIPGVYTVTLVVRNASGTNRTVKTNYIEVFPSPGVNFSASANIACRPATITFTDQTNTTGATITSWLWEFGDGTTSSDRNPTKVFDNLGYYNVSLTVTTSNGCSTTASKSRFIRIIGGVTPNFHFTIVFTHSIIGVELIFLPFAFFINHRTIAAFTQRGHRTYMNKPPDVIFERGIYHVRGAFYVCAEQLVPVF